MRCPKCGREQDDRNAICDRCGIVFEKYYKYHPPPGGQGRQVVQVSRRPVETGGLKELLFPSGQSYGRAALAARAVLLLVLFVWGSRLMLSSVESNAAGQSFLHLINLPFHEAGHIFFRPLGAFMTSLGGTLGQLLMPLICLGVLLIKTRDAFGASVALWWFGQNFLDIAPYVNDARAGRLPLLGGNFGHSAPYGFHDWEYLLTETGMLQLDQSLARLSHFTGSLVMLLAIAWGGLLLFRQMFPPVQLGRR